ncbi:hypothetical protein M2102_003318 [Fusobacterium sp. PH5-7]|uniref:DUF2577 family protein n=1 Tax=Fusobacterium sp. PH5-7 TaxID=2940528 RepID=UPI002474B951|nr:DUF2577 family protein [Fusobacterium sp. PH5-7]MDH6459656.1 hypothetical protein [Fusobacterium sp. PH5-7]
MTDWAGELLLMMKEQNINMPTQLIAKVETAPPELTLKFAEQVIPSKQIYCSNYLLPHYHRDYTIDGTVDDIELSLSKLDVNNTTSTATAESHTHSIPSIKGVGGAAGSLKGKGAYKTHGDIWFEDTLKAGDEVLVNIVGVYWVVVSKITKMPSGAIEGV